MRKMTIPTLAASLLLLTALVKAPASEAASAPHPAQIVIYQSSQSSMRIAPAWSSQTTLHANGCWTRTVRKKMRHGCLTLAQLRQVRRTLRAASTKTIHHRIRCLAVSTQRTSVYIRGKGTVGWVGPCGAVTPQASLVSAFNLVEKLAR